MKQLLKVITLLALISPPQLQAQTQLDINKSVNGGGPFTFSDVVTYTITYSVSFGDADLAIVTDTLSDVFKSALADVTLFSTSDVDSAVYNPSTGIVHFHMMPTLPAGSSGELRIQVALKDNNICTDSIVNTVHFTCNNAAPVQAEAAFLLLGDDPRFWLWKEHYWKQDNGSFTKLIGGSEEVPLGDTVKYPIFFVENENCNAYNVLIEDDIPVNLRVFQIFTGDVGEQVDVHVMYETNLSAGWVPLTGNPYNADVNTIEDINLPAGEYITKVRWFYPFLPSGTGTFGPNVDDGLGVMTVVDNGTPGDIVTNCVNGTFENVFGNSETITSYGTNTATTSNSRCRSFRIADPTVVLSKYQFKSDGTSLNSPNGKLIGGVDTVMYGLRIYNSGVLDVDSVQIEDVIPSELTVTKILTGITSTATDLLIRYKTNVNTAWRDVPGNPYSTASNTIIPVTALSLAAGEHITELQFTYPFLAAGNRAGYNGFEQPGFQAFISGGTPGSSVTNCTDGDYKYAGVRRNVDGYGTNVYGSLDRCKAFELEEPDLGIYKYQFTADGTTLANNGELYVGIDTVQYRLHPFNRGNVPVDTTIVKDVVPSNLRVTKIHTGKMSLTVDVNVEYKTNLNSFWTGLPGNPYSTSSTTTVDVSALSLGAGEYVTEIRWVYVSFPVGMTASGVSDTEKPGFHAFVDNGADGEAVVNCVSGDYLFMGAWDNIYVSNSLASTYSGCKRFYIRIAAPDIRLYKYQTMYDMYWGQEQNYSFYVSNAGDADADSVIFTDNIPTEFEVIEIRTGQLDQSLDVLVFYQTNLNAVWTGLAANPYNTSSNTTVTVASLGLAANEKITALKWVYPLLPVGANASGNQQNDYAGIKATLVSGAVNSNVLNCAEGTYQFAGGTNPITTSSNPGWTNSRCKRVEIEDPFSLYKYLHRGTSTVLDETEVSLEEELIYHVYTRYRAEIPADSIEIIDDIPTGMEVLEILTGRTTGDEVDINVFYTTNLNANFQAAPGNPYRSSSSSTIDVSTLGLAAGETVDIVKWVYKDIDASFSGYITPIGDRAGVKVKVVADCGINLQNCADAVFEVSSVGHTDTDSKCVDHEVAPVRVSLNKDLLSAPNVTIGDLIQYRLEFEPNHRTSAERTSPLVNPYIIDVLSSNFMELKSWSYNDLGTGAPTPNLQVIPDYQGTGLTALKWSWDGASAHTFYANEEVRVEYDIEVKLGIYEGSYDNEFFIESGSAACPVEKRSGYLHCDETPTDVNDLDNDGSTADRLCMSNKTTVFVYALAEINAEKSVRANSGAYMTPPAIDYVLPGDTIQYKLYMENTGHATVTDFEVIDILPHNGDYGVIAWDEARRTVFDIDFKGNITNNVPNVDVFYSTEGNPCRSDFVAGGPAGCAAANWAMTPPAALDDIKSIKFDFDTLTFAPGDSIVITYQMTVPLTIPTSFDTAWNSFAYVSNRVDIPTTVVKGESDATGIVGVMAIPSVNVSAVPDEICAGDSATLIASGATTYVWTPATGLSSTTGAVVKASPATTTTYTVTGYSGGIEIGSDSVTVTVHSIPTISINTTKDTLCFGDSSQLISSTGNVTWSPGTGLSSTTDSVVIASPTVTTTYTATTVSAFGCVGEDSIEIVVNPLPVITTTKGLVCAGDSDTLTASGADTYSWSPATGLNTTTGPVVVSSSTVGVIYTVTGTDANGCVDTTTAVMEIFALPTIILNATSDSVCAGDSTTITASGAASYSWAPMTGLTMINNATAIANPSTTTTYTVVGTKANGCSNVDSITVTVNPATNINIATSPDTICIGDTMTITASGAVSYNWSPSTGLSATNGAVVTAYPSTTTTYTVIGNNAQGCQSVDSVEVVVNSLPTITATDGEACLGNVDTLIASGAVSYSWAPATGLNTTTGPVVIASPSTVGLTTYTITGTDANGCSSSTTADVEVFSLPNVNVTAAQDSICAGDSIVLNATGADTYTWSPLTGLTMISNASALAHPLTTTTYTITGMTDKGCVDVDSITISVNSGSPINVTPAVDSICIGDSVTITASGAASYSWSPATGLNTTTGPVVVASPSVNTTYVVMAQNVSGCSSIGSVQLHVNPLPVITTTKGLVCAGGSDTLIASGAATYTWSPATGLNTTTGPVVISSSTVSLVYTVTGTDMNGCVNTATADMELRPLPNVNANASIDSICVTDSTILTASGAMTYSWSPGTGLSATTGAVVIANPLATTTYAVTGINDKGCVNVDSITVVVKTGTNISITTTPDAICLGDTMTISANGAVTYNWSPSTGLASTTGAVVIASPSTTTTYTVIGTNASGCASVDSVRVVVNPLPVLAASNGLACLGGEDTLSVTGASTYSWSPAIGLNTTSGAVAIANPTTSTTYTITGTDANGCVSSTIATMNINALPNVNLAAMLDSLCVGDSTLLTASGANTYSWSSLSDLTMINNASAYAHPSTSTTYVVVGTDTNGCVNADSVLVNVLGEPVLNIAASASTICNGDSVTITASGASTYNWSPSVGLNTTTGSVVIAMPSSSTTYTVVGTNSSGCIAIDSIHIDVNALPVISATDGAACAGASDTLTVSGAVSYSWLPSTGLNASSGAVVIANPLQTTTYTIIGTDSLGCSSTTTATMQVHALPNIQLTLSRDSICVADTLTIKASGADNYTWTPYTGLLVIDSTWVIASLGSNMTYTVVGTDANGCVGVDSITAHILPYQQVKVSGGGTICEGDSVSLTATGAATYHWSPTTGIDPTTGAVVIASPATTTTYTVIGTDTNGCDLSDSVTVLVNPTPTADFNIGNACLGDTIQFTDASTGNIVSRSWNFGDGNTSNLIDPAHLYASTGNYDVSLVVSSPEGCTDSITKQVIVSPIPSTGIQGNDICLGDTINFSSVLDSNITGWSWNMGDGNVVSGPSPSHSYANGGTYTVVLTVSGGMGCTATDTITVNVHEVKADFDFDPNGGPVPIQIQFNDLSTNAVTHHWDFGDGNTADSILNPTHTYDAGGQYIITLIVSNAFGCLDTAQKLLDVYEPSELTMPNVFTPNADGVNDVFMPDMTAIKEIEGIIFNRWGAVVYNWHATGQYWDGRSNTGLLCSDGTYFYILKATGFDNKEYNLEGFVTLLKN